MKAVYFAWVRERIGLAEEELTLPEEVRTISE
ncbi:MAG: molybdopterin synthase sulfur carrier subunit, partial [Methylocystis sp.]